MSDNVHIYVHRLTFLIKLQRNFTCICKYVYLCIFLCVGVCVFACARRVWLRTACLRVRGVFACAQRVSVCAVFAYACVYISVCVCACMCVVVFTYNCLNVNMAQNTYINILVE